MSLPSAAVRGRPALVFATLFLGACLGPRASVKQDGLDNQHLAKSAEIYWEAVRWGNHERGTPFIEDTGLQVRYRYWLEDERDQYRISDVNIMQIEMGPDLDQPVRGREREAAVHLRVEGYTLPAQVVKKDNVEQIWYRKAGTWFLEWEPPEDEEDGEHDPEDDGDSEVLDG